jgi:hypothetical protein
MPYRTEQSEVRYLALMEHGICLKVLYSMKASFLPTVEKAFNQHGFLLHPWLPYRTEQSEVRYLALMGNGICLKVLYSMKASFLPTVEKALKNETA